LNRKEILLYLLSKARVVRGKTRIQKLVFLVQEEKGMPLDYTFYPYDQGPLSFELSDEINSLINSGLVIESITDTVYAPRHDFMLSNIGEKYVETIMEDKLSPREKRKIQSVINKWNARDLRVLLEYVHDKYPDYRA